MTANGEGEVAGGQLRRAAQSDPIIYTDRDYVPKADSEQETSTPGSAAQE
jgi:hypothetical protein